MAAARDWVAGARPRTLPAAIVPVAVGTGVAIAYGGLNPGRAALALFVSLALQIGVNYANDYSDGIRGTDEQRIGPVRLVGSGLVPARHVLAAALGCFAAACVAGLVLAALTSWWVLL
ncbi:MAG: 1,4-dihydroxy-2-naphthoate octaprenyltransferase, partial [Actinomycetota bacterium]